MYQSSYEHRTEPIPEIAIAIRAIEIEQTGIGTVAKVTATNGERIVQPREDRVVQFNP